ncbi:uncharacterized protein LOC124540537 [Vanessa cardui]|uniref:uncharacterized protein LOC124540537 n=1 Tax=Vanessa cardui TaxID=171605 RepID=UPI001F1370B9|nr:uncharacterized protein LOC124540537 [Vanessa cardui]
MTVNNNNGFKLSQADNCVQGVGLTGLRFRNVWVMCGLRVGCVVGVLMLGFVVVGASEFPERECCDPVYPPNTATTAAAPVTHPVSKVSGPGPGIKGTMAILNCLLARQLCFEDASCSAILEIIPRVCGSELVACSTVTVTKCQAALRTLQAFPFFKPTCLCREPNVDPECNSFRDFLFDHPCVFVMKKEKDPYPVETLPTCTYALSVCHNEKACSVLFERFKNACKARDGECRMEDREACREAWAGLRLSPLFGCICPNTHMKKRCDRIFAVVNHNPCVVKLMSDGRIANRNASGVTSWIGGMSITQDGNLIAPDKIMTHVHRYSSPHYKPHGHHYHRWNHEPGGSEDPLYATKTVYGQGYIDENQRIAKENGKAGDDKVALQSTCHVALDTCIKDSECVASLTPVLQKCHATDCDREGCMTALRGFYRKPGVQWNTEIAFCLCKKTDNKEDSCMNAQERLHPSCAQRPPVGSPLPACHTLAHACREDPECRIRLENYEQWCAVDAVTQGCAGSPAACRAAVVAVLGTQLRAACACRGTDFAQLYDCLGWQRLLWLNPCVVESQSDYHVKTYGSLHTTTHFDNGIRYITLPPEPPIHHRTTTHHHRHTTQHGTSQVNVMQENREELSPITTMSEQTIGPNEVAQISEPVIETTTATTTIATTTTTQTSTTTTSTTTTTTPRPTTTLEPAKYCIVKKPESDDQAQYIKMGETRRLYRSAELAECTDLCVCEASLQVSCKVACVPRAPCSSRLAHYSHAAPAYQAYRGRCYCYSGSFICMRPNPGEYKLPEGVYLLLGFSAVDEALLRPHTGLGAEDAVRLLQQYLHIVHHGETNCTLTLFNISNENVIISASVPQKEQDALREAGEGLLDREKEACIDVLKIVKSHINSQHEDISSHLLLSIFKIAEVDVVYPAPPSSAINSNGPNITLYIMITILTFIYNLQQLISFLKTIIFFKNIVNCLTNLMNINKVSTKRYSPSDSLDVVPFSENYIIKDFLSILECYEEFIKYDTVVVVNCIDTSHDALALDNAQVKHITEDIIVVSDIDVNKFKETKHIIKAVSITISTNLNELVANAIIPKYFSRDVYYEIGCTIINSEKLFGELCFEKIASSSYGIVKSVSLGLTLVVV